MQSGESVPEIDADEKDRIGGQKLKVQGKKSKAQLNFN